MGRVARPDYPSPPLTPWLRFRRRRASSTVASSRPRILFIMFSVKSPLSSPITYDLETISVPSFNLKIRAFIHDLDVILSLLLSLILVCTKKLVTWEKPQIEKPPN
ncbi:unnamed protein product [Cuscuta epithymum]|uniref:Uncharacterized protein n=1 Tax=Cuscuta epithymum TaxID=186058 RepID=A0AAV0FB29_9ASTE|nr:unnamed protein product [Cuscuta epithymum]